MMLYISLVIVFFANDPHVCVCVFVCRANIMNRYVLCLTAVYVWKCMLCVRGCANVVVWRFLCIRDGV